MIFVSYICSFVDRDMLMRYHIGLGIGHVYTQCQASSDVDQETTSYTTRDDDMEEEYVFEIPDNGDLSGDIVQEVESGSEHSSDFGNESGEEEEEEEEIRDEEFLIDEDLYGY
jgi:hypothetical protein